jgi:uncharacterized protein YjdB
MGNAKGRGLGSALIVVAAVCCSDPGTGSTDVITAIEVSPPTANVQVGFSTSLTATARGANNSVIPGPALTWSSSNVSVATVTPSGQVTGIAVGSAVIRAVAGSVGDSALVTVSAASGGALANECAAQAPAWIWCDDFSQDRVGSYFEYDPAGGSFVRAAGVGMDGTFGMRAHFNAGQVNGGSLKLAFGRGPNSYMRPVDAGTANYRDLFWRVFLRNAPNWTGGGGDKLGRMTIFASPVWAQALIAHIWSGVGSSGINNLVMDPASGTDEQGNLRTIGYNDFANLRWLGAVQGPTPLFASNQVGQWYCVETHVSINDAGQNNGLFEFWINGTLQARSANLNWVGSYNAYGLNALFLENYWNSGSPQEQERYFDNLIVSTQRIGCGFTPSAAAVSTVSVGPPNPTVPANGTVQLSATLRDASGNTLTGRTVDWSSTNTTVATVSPSGLVTGRATGSAVVSARSEGRVGSATVTVVPPEPVATVTVTPSPAPVWAGNTIQLMATLRDASGDVLLGRTVTWSSGNSSVATVSAAGLVTALAVGQATLTATSEGRTGSTSVTVTAPPPPPPGLPSPQPADLVVFDTRAGGAQSIQSVNTFAEAMQRFTEWRSSNTFATNMDGNGTRAIRHQYSAASGCAQQEQSPWTRVYPLPVLTKEVYYQFKYRMGRHPNDAGTTFGEVNRFQITNDPCNSANGTNYGMKLAIFSRTHPSDGLGNAGRTDIIFGGPAPSNFSVRCDGCPGVAYYANWRPQEHVGESIIVTLYLKAESGENTNDGIVRAWVDGTLLIDHTNADLTSRYFSGPEIISVMNTPQINQIVYTWDHLIWIPN